MIGQKFKALGGRKGTAPGQRRTAPPSSQEGLEFRSARVSAGRAAGSPAQVGAGVGGRARPAGLRRTAAQDCTQAPRVLERALESLAPSFSPGRCVGLGLRGMSPRVQISHPRAAGVVAPA